MRCEYPGCGEAGSASKEFLDAGRKRLAGDTARQANPGEGKDLCAEAVALKELVKPLALSQFDFTIPEKPATAKRPSARPTMVWQYMNHFPR